MGHHTLPHSRPVSSNQWSLAQRENSIPSIRSLHCIADRRCSFSPATGPLVSAVSCNDFNCDTQGLAAGSLHCQNSMLVSRESAHSRREPSIRSSSEDKRNSFQATALGPPLPGSDRERQSPPPFAQTIRIGKPPALHCAPGATIGGSFSEVLGRSGRWA